jgi:AbrB family looped-hinge helix DNA binding protein
MAYIGSIWNILEKKIMLAFCGQDKSSIDSNGRVKFSPRTSSDFQNECNGEVVLHCLPEGALAVYPEDIYMKIRRGESRSVEKAGNSLVFRRNLRRFGALSSSEKISAQGRITIPSGFRKMLDLNPGEEIVVVGAEIGVEIWNSSRWDAEIEQINSHTDEKGAREMAADLEYSEYKTENHL